MEPNVFTRIGVALHKMLAASNVDDVARQEIHDLGAELQTIESDLAGIQTVVESAVSKAVADLTASFEGRLKALEDGVATIDQLVSGTDTTTAPSEPPTPVSEPAKDEAAAAVGDAPVTDESTGQVTEPATPVAPASDQAPEPAPAAADPAPAEPTPPAAEVSTDSTSAPEAQASIDGGTGSDTVTAPEGGPAA